MTDKTANTTNTTNNISRIHSTQTEHLREDLTAAFDLVMELIAPDLEDPIKAGKIVADLYHPHNNHAEGVASWLNPSDTLRRVREEFGKNTFGIVTLFSIEAETSLARYCKSLTSKQELASMGMTTRDLGWPKDMLHPAYGNDGQHWSEYERNTFSTAVENWKQTHPDLTMRTVTAIGF